MAEVTRDVIDAFIGKYFPGYSDGEKIPHGNSNYNHSFVAESKKYVLRIYIPFNKDNPRNKHDIERELELIEIFKRYGIPTPAPIKSKEGRLLTQHSDYYAAVFPLVKGQRAYKAMTDDHFVQLGTLMARMHDISIADSLTGRKYCNEMTFWEFVWEKADKGVSLLGEYEQQVLHDTKDRRQNLEATPTKLIHGDFHFANTLFHDGKISALLDFESIRMGHLAEDITRFFIADLAHSTPEWYEIKKSFIRAFWKGYSEGRDLEADERGLLRTYCDLHYLNQHIRLKKKKYGWEKEFRRQCELLKNTLENITR